MEGDCPRVTRKSPSWGLVLAEARPRTPAETGLFKPEVQRWLAAGGRSKFTEGDMLSEGWGAGEMEQMVGE